MFRWALGSLLLVVALVSVQSAKAQEFEFSKVAVFGDSLCDTGNLFISVAGAYPFSGPDALFPIFPYGDGKLTYPGGRFSDGPIWIEELTGDLNFSAPDSIFVSPGSLNFAFGGAESGDGFSQRETPNLGEQIGLFKTFYPAGFSGDELVVVWIGGNDYNPLPGQDLPNPADVVSNFTAQMEKLIAEGGETFLVPNVPPLGSIPQVRSLGPEAEFLVNLIILQHNLLLEGALQDLENEHDVRIYRFNVFGVVAAVDQNPTAFGFTNTTEPAFDLANLTVVPNPQDYVYWDTIHPTTASHKILGSVASSILLTKSTSEYVTEELSIRGFLSGLVRLDLTLRLMVTEAYLQMGRVSEAIDSIESFRSRVTTLKRIRRISNADANSMKATMQTAIDVLGN